uniref:Serine recombinase n=1 Tax=Polaromonas sp. E10S TaxID=1840239 RepID=A0A2S1FIC8_9BURK|nr:recombinase family protein [Polaromonas sp. E10S]AWD71956.1 serine recombinase [Polaromonas sp. E10S]
MKIGYARVLTEDQVLGLQKDALKSSGCEGIYEKHASGKSTDRPAIESCLQSLRSSDMLCVWHLDRLERNLADLVRIVTELDAKGVAFVSLTERIETGLPAGKLVFHVFAAIAELERNLIRERTVARLDSARKHRRTGGRPKKVSARDLPMLAALMRDPNHDPADIAERFIVRRSTLYRLAKSAENDVKA